MVVPQGSGACGDDARTAMSEVRRALALAAPALSRHPEELAGQLTGRLDPSHGPAIARLVGQARDCAPRPALLPATASLAGPRGAALAVLGDHGSRVDALAVLRDGRVASGGWGGRIVAWDPEAPGKGTSLGDHGDSVNALAVLRDGRVASGGRDGRIVLWDVASLSQGPELHLGAPVLAAVATGGRVVASAGGHLHVLKVVT